MCSFYFTHLEPSSLPCLVPLPLPDPPDHQEAVQEVGADDIRQEGGLALLVDQSNDVVAYMPLPLQLCSGVRYVHYLKTMIEMEVMMALV